MQKECEDCYSMGGCYFIPHIDPSLCPCKDCLLKGICIESCDKWLEVESIVIGIIEIKKEKL